MDLPEKMRALQIDEYGGVASLKTVTRAVPRPGPGQVLIKVAAAAVNPSDLSFLEGTYGVVKELPVVPGFVGSGTAVAAGGGLYAGFLNGKRLACSAPADGQGVWAEYMVADAQGCIPLKKNVDFEFGANMIVNPLTAVALVELARQGGHKAIVQNAAASALGQMILRLARSYGLPTVNLVRRAEQVQVLKGIDAGVVIDTSREDWKQEFERACRELEATVAFDAVAGEMTDALAAHMPPGSTITVYGGLSGQASQFAPSSSIFRRQTLNGFWLSAWLAGKKPWQLLSLSNKVQGKLAEHLTTPIRERYDLDRAVAGIRSYAESMTGGKVLIVP